MIFFELNVFQNKWLSVVGVVASLQKVSGSSNADNLKTIQSYHKNNIINYITVKDL